MRWLLILAVLFLLAGCTSQDTVHVDKVIDGDTFQSGNQFYRLLSINAPEQGERGYANATRYLRERIEGRDVTVEYGNTRKDHWGRWLVWVFRGGKFVNAELARSEWYHLAVYSDNNRRALAVIEAWLDRRSGVIRSFDDITGP